MELLAVNLGDALDGLEFKDDKIVEDDFADFVFGHGIGGIGIVERGDGEGAEV